MHLKLQDADVCNFTQRSFCHFHADGIPAAHDALSDLKALCAVYNVMPKIYGRNNQPSFNTRNDT
jgi:hypothetical protein